MVVIAGELPTQEGKAEMASPLHTTRVHDLFVIIIVIVVISQVHAAYVPRHYDSSL